MAILFQSSSSSMLSIKIFVISTTVLSAAIMLKISAPAVTEFAVSEVPSIWNGVVSWLKPPYLYLVINCIIITIVASSKLQNKFDENSSPAVVSSENMAQFHPVKDVRPATDYYSPVLHDVNGVVLKNQAVEARPVVYEYPTPGVYEAKVEKVTVDNPYGHVDARTSEKETSFNLNGFTYPEPSEVVAEKEVVISNSSRVPVMRQDSIDYSVSGKSAEKPPASARFAHRKNVRSTPEGKSNSSPSFPTVFPYVCINSFRQLGSPEQLVEVVLKFVLHLRRNQPVKVACGSNFLGIVTVWSRAG